MGFGWLGAKVGRHGEDAVRFLTEFHSATSAFCQDVVDRGVLVRRILMNHRQCPVAVRAEKQVVAWIETGSVHTLANRCQNQIRRVSESSMCLLGFRRQLVIFRCRMRCGSRGAPTGGLNLESQRSALLVDHHDNGGNRLRR